MAKNQKEQVKLNFKTGNIVLLYPNIFEPRSFDEKSKPTYSTIMLMKNDSKELENLKKSINKVWKEAKLKQGDHLPVFDGKEFGYEGYTAVKTKSDYKPPVVGADCSKVPDNALSYAELNGYFARLMLQITSYSYAGKEGVKLYLKAVQLLWKSDIVKAFDITSEFDQVTGDQMTDFTKVDKGNTNEGKGDLQKAMNSKEDLPF